MPTITLTDSEAQQLIQMLINSNPLIVKIVQQVQEQAQRLRQSSDDHGDSQGK